MSAKYRKSAGRISAATESAISPTCGKSNVHECEHVGVITEVEQICQHQERHKKIKHKGRTSPDLSPEEGERDSEYQDHAR